VGLTVSEEDIENTRPKYPEELEDGPTQAEE